MMAGSSSLSQAASNGCEFATKGEKFEQQGSTELSADDSNKDLILCPLANFGCCQTPMSKDALELHVQFNHAHHLHLLVH